MMKTMFRRIWGTLLALALVLPLCACGGTGDPIRQGIVNLLSPDETYEKDSTSSLYRVQDNPQMYADREDGIVTMYLTVGMGTDADGVGHTWTEINSHSLSWYDAQGLEPYRCEALLQVGDEQGPLAGKFGYGELAANATVRLRGTGASEQAQKSYRIDIKNGAGSWEDQKVVVLNKHVTDPLRFRNKLAYDLMAEIPEMFSARTWFVHLYVKDRSEGKNGLFEDYGLFTAVEQINKRYLKNRGLDSGGNLYKAGEFDWRPHPEALKPATSVDFDQDAFEALLENKGDVDHSKLLALLSAVDDESQPIWDVVMDHFDTDSLFYWMAFHILMGNRDVERSNYYLYSPQGVNQWYLLSWDNDKLLPEAYEKLRDAEYDPAWNHGIFTFVSARLYERMMKDERCREELDSAVEDLRETYLTKENIQEKAGRYADLIKDTVYSLPDEIYQRVSSSNYDVLVNALADEMAANYEAYQRSLKEPWPFHILDPVAGNGKLTLRWEDSYLYQGTEPVYSVELADDPMFTDPLLDLPEQTGNSCTLDMLPEGQYFLRVRAGDGEGNWQGAYEYYLTETDKTVTGTICFYVLEDGTVQVNEYYEE